MNLKPETASIFIKDWSVEFINTMHQNTLCAHLGMQFTERGANFLSARMPVDARTTQPLGILHGGASVALAETLGSVAAWLCLEDGWNAVGLDINANHIRGATTGWVYGKATPVHVGRTTQVWQIEIVDERNKLVCSSRITMAIIRKPRRRCQPRGPGRFRMIWSAR